MCPYSFRKSEINVEVSVAGHAESTMGDFVPDFSETNVNSEVGAQDNLRLILLRSKTIKSFLFSRSSFCYKTTYVSKFR